MFTVIRPPRLLTCPNANVPTPSSWRDEAFLQRSVGWARPRSILRAEGIYIESRRACSKAEVTCCSEMAEALSASSAHPRQWSRSRHTNASSLQSLAAPSSQPMMRARLVRQSSRAFMMDDISRMRTRSREAWCWYAKHSGHWSLGSWTSSPVVVTIHWAGGESSRAVTRRRFS